MSPFGIDVDNDEATEEKIKQLTERLNCTLGRQDSYYHIKNLMNASIETPDVKSINQLATQPRKPTLKNNKNYGRQHQRKLTRCPWMKT